jgi:hypothetical protein
MRWAHHEFTRIDIALTMVKKEFEEILGKSRSCPVLLMISLIGRRRTVSGSRKKSQEIWPCAASGGLSLPKTPIAS